MTRGVLVAVGRHDQRRAGQRKQLVLRADEDAHARALLRRDRAAASARPGSPGPRTDACSSSMSAWAVTFSSRLARPRTMSRAGRPPSEPAQTASPFSTRSCDSVSSAALVSSLSLPISALASASVRPWICALRKFEASCSCEAVDAGRQLDDAVLDVAVLRDQHGQRLGRLELDEFDVLERAPRSWRRAPGRRRATCPTASGWPRSACAPARRRCPTP